MTLSDSPVLISPTSTGSPSLMNGTLFSCRACRISLTPMKREDRRQPVGQVDQPVEQAVDQEVQLAQARAARTRSR